MSEPTVARSGTQVLESIEGQLNSIKHVLAIPNPIRKRESDDLRELYKALGAAQKKFMSIHKSGLISGRNIPYAKINDLVDASRDALYINNLAVNTYSTFYPNGYETLTTRLYHVASGQYMESELSILNNEDDQKRGSSITYAWRYTYSPLLGLVDNSSDDDGEISSHKAPAISSSYSNYKK